MHLGSNLIWKYDLAKKGPLTEGMKLPVGALVFTGDSESSHPHIGRYTGGGWVTEATGAKGGVIQSKLNCGKWKWWGLEKGVTYDFIPEEAEKPAETAKPKDPATWPTLRKGNKNTYVKQMQQMLDKLGYNLGICGIDGDFGTATEKAVEQFQKDHGLTVDGICGPKTLEALRKAVENPEPQPAEKKYRITVTGLTKAQADEIQKKYGGTVAAE